VITVLICTTLLVLFKDGINIKLSKEIKHVYRDDTSFDRPDVEQINLKEKEPEEIRDFVKDTIETMNSYLEDDKDEQKSKK